MIRNEGKNKKEAGTIGREFNGTGLEGIDDVPPGIALLNTNEAAFLGMEKQGEETVLNREDRPRAD